MCIRDRVADRRAVEQRAETAEAALLESKRMLEGAVTRVAELEGSLLGKQKELEATLEEIGRLTVRVKEAEQRTLGAEKARRTAEQALAAALEELVQVKESMADLKLQLRRAEEVELSLRAEMKWVVVRLREIEKGLMITYGCYRHEVNPIAEVIDRLQNNQSPRPVTLWER
eukprot:TRINITY_DN39523_c0_g1_i1.p1 TRINITY_DN39523_c0_g1~~TRINITY_DN39523_c0_g1_i1.p1  ORF type:complete len:202 (+),score=36.58 TRINITY_DN39523_c0_g1_i1:93-608(+)